MADIMESLGSHQEMRATRVEEMLAMRHHARNGNAERADKKVKNYILIRDLLLLNYYS